MTLYEETSERLKHLIEEGTYRAGDRMPSVRSLSREWGVSITTVLESYRRLENAGYIEARPQSGHYVLPRPGALVAMAPKTEACFAPTEVTTAELTWRLIRDATGDGFVKFGGAVPSPDLLPVEKLNRALSSAMRRVKSRGVSYPPMQGVEAFRAQIARRAVAAGCSLSPDEILVTSGCMEAVHLSLRAVTKPGDTVAVESPMYFGFLQALEDLGLRALEIPCDPRHGLSIDALRFALDNHPVRAVLCSTNFSNPLGSLMSEQRKRELVELLADREIPLIEDDLYGEMYFASQQRPPSAKSFDEKGLVLWCSSISKTLAPGWRVGWVAGGRFQHAIERLKIITNVTTSSPPQHALVEFYESGGYDHHLRTYIRTLRQRVDWLSSEVRKHFPAGTIITPPQGGMVVWIELPDAVDSVALFRKALCEKISVAPGVLFSTSERYRHFLRLNASFAVPNHAKAIATIGQMVAELMESPEPAARETVG